MRSTLLASLALSLSFTLVGCDNATKKEEPATPPVVAPGEPVKPAMEGTPAPVTPAPGEPVKPMEGTPPAEKKD